MALTQRMRGSYPGLTGGCDRRKALSCTNSPADFVDSRGDACDVYLANPCFCQDAANFTNADGIHAGMACCACGGLETVGRGGGNTQSCTLTCFDLWTQADGTNDGRCTECSPDDPWCACPYGSDPECCSEDRPCGEGQFCDLNLLWVGLGVCRDCASCQGESCGWFSCGESFWSEPGFENCAASCGYAHNLYGRRHLPANKTPEHLVRAPCSLLALALNTPPARF